LAWQGTTDMLVGGVTVGRNQLLHTFTNEFFSDSLHCGSRILQLRATALYFVGGALCGVLFGSEDLETIF
jgi:hypothetical protein